MKKHFLFLPLFLLMTLILSCNKETTIQLSETDDFKIENFISDDNFGEYNSHYNPLPLLESRSKNIVSDRLKSYFTKYQNVSKKVEQKYGIPIWSSSFFMDGELGTAYQVPLAKKNSKSTEAVLFAAYNKKNELYFKIFDKKDIKKLTKKGKSKKRNGYDIELTQDYFAGTIMYFDHITFQTKDCDLINYAMDGQLTQDVLETRSCYEVKQEIPQSYQIVNGELVVYSGYTTSYYVCLPSSGGTYTGGYYNSSNYGNTYNYGEEEVEEDFPLKYKAITLGNFEIRAGNSWLNGSVLGTVECKFVFQNWGYDPNSGLIPGEINYSYIPACAGADISSQASAYYTGASGPTRTGSVVYGKFDFYGGVQASISRDFGMGGSFSYKNIGVEYSQSMGGNRHSVGLPINVEEAEVTFQRSF